MEIHQFTYRRPYLYHLTAVSNSDRLQQNPVLYSAAAIARQAAKEIVVFKRRRTHEFISGIHIRDQAPLHEGNIEFTGGASFADILELLNSRVFFWPGTKTKPIRSGLSHFSRYSSETPIVLRVPTASIITQNRETEPELCRYNSGSPRCSGGKKSPRGFDTFTAISKYKDTPSSVVEVTFRGKAKLPSDTEFGTLVGGIWQSVQ